LPDSARWYISFACRESARLDHQKWQADMRVERRGRERERGTRRHWSLRAISCARRFSSVTLPMADCSRGWYLEVKLRSTVTYNFCKCAFSLSLALALSLGIAEE
jgi:hypothetical protein